MMDAPPPTREQAGARAAPALATARRPRRDWERWPLSGPFSLDLGGKVFRLPLGSEVRMRGSLAWVRVRREAVYVISLRGSLDLSDAERGYYARAEVWSRI